MELHKFYPTGDWKNHADSMELVSEEGTIQLLYNAKEVNIVTENGAEIEILVDGNPLPAEYSGKDVQPGSNILSVSEPNLYNIINSDESSSHVLELKIKGKGFQIFTFTFG